MKVEDRVAKTVVFQDEEKVEKGVVIAVNTVAGRQAVEVRWNGRGKALTTVEWADELLQRD